MAGRSRRSAAADIVEEDEEQGSLKKLKFKQPLVGRPGKQISVGELLARLTKLCEELRSLEQEEADRETLEPVAKELAHHSLVQHKDAGVRAWTACCIVDMFRLCAPDAPYTAAQLKDIFTLIVVKIFPALADPSNPYNAQHLYVLKCLAEVKSIVLLTDIPGSGQLTTTLFRNCFDVLSGPSKAANGEELSKNVEHHMTAVLAILVDEAPSLSSEVVDVIVAQFLWADPISLGATKGKKVTPVDAKQSTLLRKEAPPAYNMAKNVCKQCPDKMARYIGSYFSSVIVDFTSIGVGSTKSRHGAGGDQDEADDEHTKGPSEDDLNDASKAHRLLRELWRCAPGVLQDIIPHLQEELGTDNIQLRQLATETFGDMISGIGAAGPPPRPEMNPAAYPSQSLTPSEPRPYNFLTTPTSPNSFPSLYPAAYHAFLQRRHDKSPIIRAAWTTGVGRILMTSAGGVGLDSDEEQKLLKHFAETLIDSDERVRLAAVRAVDHFDFDSIVQKLGRDGSMSDSGSILANLAARVKDRKSILQSESMKLLGKIWGVAAGAITEGNERITTLLGPIPSRILEACYVNDPELNVRVDLTLFDSLLPLGYPPMKPRATTNGGSQVVKDSQTTAEQGYTEAELDKIRVERQLLLVKGLEEKAKKVFFAKQANQANGAKFMEHFLKLCEEYNGGVMDKGAKDTKTKLEGLIAYYAKTLPEPARVISDLWKFAEAHDRRNYQLIRFCMAPESEYRKVYRSIKELRKRLQDNPVSATILDTLTPLVYRVALLCYNKSHLPGIIAFSRTDEGGLGPSAHEVLKEISTNHPKVFSTHVNDLCKALEAEAPTVNAPNPPGAVEDLKACAGFAKKFPKDLPLNAKDGKKLTQSFVNFALYGSPPEAAKHAITIIVNSDSRKEMRVKDILAKSIKGFEYGGDHFLTKLAALAQMVLFAPEDCEQEIDSIIDIAVNRVLLKAHPVTPEAESEWMDNPDEDMVARTWALKILVNRLRSFRDPKISTEVASPIYTLLNRLVKESGEASKKKLTPLAHKNLQRLLAAQFLLKLSCTRRLDALLSPTAFVELALVTHDKHAPIRKGFASKLMKYLGQNRLPTRFYSILFLFAYEPDSALLESVSTWIRSRRSAFAARKEVIFETNFARLLSILAYHPDFDTDHKTLKVMTRYILFYLKCVATADNISLIYHVAQRVKGVADGITASAQADENLYILSDLSQALIRLWEEQNGWSMQSWPGKLKLPAGIFKPLESHERAQEIADKVWIDEDLTEELEPLVRGALRSKKRRATEGTEGHRKKVKSERDVKKEKVKAEKAKTAKPKRRHKDDSDDEVDAPNAAPAAREPRRKSDRRSGVNKSYVEVSSDEDQEDEIEEDAEGGAQEDEDTDLSDPASAGEGSEPEQDVQMAEVDPEEEEEQDSNQAEVEKETSPEPPKSASKPPRRGARGKPSTALPAPSAKDDNEDDDSHIVLNGSTPAKPARGKGKAKSKAAAKEVASSSSPAVNSVRRSTRTRG